MRVDDLDLKELVEFDSEDGVIRFAGQRALIIDAAAKGNLRKELVNHFGLTTARAILTRFGFVQGWRMAEAMQDLVQVGERGRLAPRGRAHPHARGDVPPGAGQPRLADEGGADARRLVRGGAAHRPPRPQRHRRCAGRSAVSRAAT